MIKNTVETLTFDANMRVACRYFVLINALE